MIKKEKIFVDILQININNKIYLTFAKKILQIAINISKKLITNK